MTPHASPGSHRWRWATLAILCVTLLLVSIDLTILTVALPSIVNSLHATSSQLQWIIDAYAIAFAVGDGGTDPAAKEAAQRGAAPPRGAGVQDE